MKRFAALVLTLVWILSLGSNAWAGYGDNPLPDSQRQYKWNTEPKTRPYVQTDAPYAAEVFASGLNGDKALMPYVVEQSDEGLRICQVVTLDCLSRSTLVPIMGFFQLCSDDSFVACIDSITYKDSNGKWAPATVLEQVDETPEPLPKDIKYTSTIGELGWSSIKEVGLPGSAKGPLVISLPGIKNAAGSETYVLMADYWMEKLSQYPQPFRGNLRSFDMSLRPVYLDKTHGNSMYRWTYSENGRDNLVGTGSYQVDFNDESVAESNKNEIGWAADFGDSTQLRIALRLPKSMGGWFQSRLSDPAITVSNFSQDTNLVTVSGGPVTIPATEGAIDLRSKDAESQVRSTFGQQAWDSWTQNGPNGFRGIWTWTTWRPDAGVEAFNKWRDIVGDRATGSSNVWTISHVDSSSPCMNENSSLQGLVNTNSLVYQPSVPSFEDGFLKYRVAGQHFDWRGEVFQGTYTFIMRSSVARCLYGFRDAPISGTVSVTSNAGDEQVAYTNVSERDGWLKLVAQGFTFSNPVISAKLTQEPEPVPSPKPEESKPAFPQASPSPTPPLTKHTITCIKGKSIKKVTGIKPKCPTGYKKKA